MITPLEPLDLIDLKILLDKIYIFCKKLYSQKIMEAIIKFYAKVFYIFKLLF